jgi:transcriptional regulator with XRE-family HTH domain
MPDFRSTIREAMKAQEITQAEAGKRLGVHQQSVQRFLAGGRWPVKYVESLCEILGLDLSETRKSRKRKRLQV